MFPLRENKLIEVCRALRYDHRTPEAVPFNSALDAMCFWITSMNTKLREYQWWPNAAMANALLGVVSAKGG